tara:strand:+ start:75 stop:254 length:180 start_codon:yes stop_codon:yes gene_type:complete
MSSAQDRYDQAVATANKIEDRDTRKLAMANIRAAGCIVAAIREASTYGNNGVRSQQAVR